MPIDDQADGSCPACGAPGPLAPSPLRTRQLDLPGELAVRGCGICGHCLLWPVPTDDWLRAFYARSAGYAPEAFSAQGAAIAGAQRAALLAHLDGALEGLPRRLFDLGCGDGALLEVARARGWDASGYEPTAALADAARARGLAVCGAPSLDEVRLPEASQSLVHCAHVLEHVPRPGELLRWARRHLRPRGALYLQLPNQFDDLLWPVLHRRWIARGKANGYHLHHLHFFTARSLAALVRRTGFEVVSLSTRFSLRTRRTAAESRTLAGRLLKTAVCTIGGALGRGPHLELLARRPAGA